MDQAEIRIWRHGHSEVFVRRIGNFTAKAIRKSYEASLSGSGDSTSITFQDGTTIEYSEITALEVDLAERKNEGPAGYWVSNL